MLTLLSALAIAATTPAAPAAVRSVTVNDRVISYTVQPRADGSYVLASAPRTPSDFRLRVRKGWVFGYVEGTPVSFRVPARTVSRDQAD